MKGKGDPQIRPEEKLTSPGFPQRVRKRGKDGKCVVSEGWKEKFVTAFWVSGSLKVIFSLLFSVQRGTHYDVTLYVSKF